MSELKEIMEMPQILLSMGTETYTKCKYMFLASSMNYPRINAAFIKMFKFKIVDEQRALLIEMKEEGVE